MILDYSYARPTPAAMATAGVVAVMRYLSPTPSKNLSVGERDGLHAAGLGIGLVWESVASRAGQGYAAGQADARAAEGQADALGYPAGCPIFYAVDYAATPAAVAPYFQGVASVAHRPVGVYGSASIVEGVPVPWKWQTSAWSGGRISPVAHLYQTTETPPVPGTDVNHVRRPFPLWAAAGVTTASDTLLNLPGTLPAAPGALTATPPTAAQEDDMTPDQSAALDEVRGNAQNILNGVKALMDAIGTLAAGPLHSTHAGVDVANAKLDNLTNGVLGLLGRPPATITAAEIAAAIPTDLAKAVADELAKRLAQ